jgi:hypothetical protein
MINQPSDGKSRRDFLKDATWMGAGLTLYGLGKGSLWAADSPADSPAAGASAGNSTPTESLTWLGGNPPLTSAGVSWGVPWARGAMPKDSELALQTADGQPVPVQSWPLAYWPDGSLKWSGLAIAADPQLTGPLTVAAGSSIPPKTPLAVRQDGSSIEISTGPLVCRLKSSGSNIIESILINGTEVGRNGRLVASREDRSAFKSRGMLRTENYTSQVSKMTVEQSGPVRAVIKVEGMHRGVEQDRDWLPFFVRLYFTAGLSSIRIIHSFVFDGDAQTDFIRGLGLAFTVPFREERQNRHARFAGDGDGIWGEPVLMSPGYREVLVKGAAQMNDDQLASKRIPNLDALGEKEKAQFETVAVWDAFKLFQSGPDSFTLNKRTNEDSSWLHILNGVRSRGLVFVGDVSGGLAVGVKRFWEKHPSALEITGASTPEAELNIWFWSPDAPAMDLRHYDTVGHDGRISYEDHQPGFSTPTGVANTNELTLWAMAETPQNADLAALAKTANEPPLLVCQPEYYQKTAVLGIWSLPDRSTPDTAAVEDQLDRAWTFYNGEVDRRRWYGFWDFGDFMRTYDGRRHEWMYDIGGHAWNNTELMPNAWLWFTFLRSGRADAFRLAEAMTRNTSEVDVYHLGRFAGLGSRHNVSHWGCGAKESRISEAWLKRFYYYLTTDERTGDLMREVLTVDETIAKVQPLREELVRPEVPVIIRIGPDWLALASNWMTEWERTGNVKYRDYVLTGMKCIGAMPEALVTRQAYRYDLKTKQLFDIGEPNLKAGEFLDLFGGDQIAVELTQLIDCPEFAKAWNHLCDKWAKDPKWNGYTKMRMSAYAANMDGDASLKAQAWQLLLASLKEKGQDRFPATPTWIVGPAVPEPVQEIPGVNTPGVSQWALNVMTTMQLAREFKA